MQPYDTTILIPFSYDRYRRGVTYRTPFPAANRPPLLVRKVASHVVKPTRRRVGRIHDLPDARIAKTCVEPVEVLLQVHQLPRDGRVGHTLKRRCKRRRRGGLRRLRDAMLQTVCEERRARSTEDMERSLKTTEVACMVSLLQTSRVQLREPWGGWRPWVADTTLPFDGYVRRLPWKPASWKTSFSSSVRNRLTASAGWFLRLDVLL